MPTASVLLSRQPLQPSAGTPWVRATEQALRWLGEKGYSILTSEGIQTYELILYFCVKYRINLIIVLCSTDMHHFINRYLWVKDQFDCFSCNTVFVPIICTKKEDCYKLRDQYIVENADLLLPVSIRNSGEMTRLLETCKIRGQAIDTRFQIPYEPRLSALKYSIKTDIIGKSIKSIENEYVVHWTRSCSYAWPGERLQTYYNAVSACRNYPRNAFFTLQNIICSSTIKASSRHMPRDVRVVSFTGHSPSYFSSLMNWRSRYMEMSYEPYGIGIEKKAALQFGIRPVIYQKNRNCSNPNERWLIQTYGKSSYWPDENEYRYPDDVDLSLFSTEQLICFCLNADEAYYIEQKFGIRTLSFCEKEPSKK